jgi:hypothetical protein
MTSELGLGVHLGASVNRQLYDSYTTPRPHIRLGLMVNFAHNLASR